MTLPFVAEKMCRAAGSAFGREHGITVIDGGCPCMFEPTADFGHKVMRVMFTSHVPKRV